MKLPGHPVRTGERNTVLIVPLPARPGPDEGRGKQRPRFSPFGGTGHVLVKTISGFTREQREEQSRWYLGELEKFEKKAGIDFIIVCCHQPPFTNSTVVHPNGEARVNFADPFLQFHETRLFFTWHNHSYERFQRKDKFFIVSGGGGGPRHKVYTDPRKRRVLDLFSGPELRFFHFCEVKYGNDTLAFRVLRLESDETFSIADSFTLPKMRR